MEVGQAWSVVVVSPALAARGTQIDQPRTIIPPPLRRTPARAEHGSNTDRKDAA
jgi:hypothetical protein